MRSLLHTLIIVIAALNSTGIASAAQTSPASEWTPTPLQHEVDLDMVARIREEGLQHSQLARTLSYMTDVLGARLTNSDDMARAQAWVLYEMKRIGSRSWITG